jgi:predicted outer membrane repeat protein
MPSHSTKFSLKPLYMALAGALALSAVDAAVATTRVVTSCADDSGAGTLRAQIGLAGSGDTIDLTDLPQADAACTASTITLTQGQIAVSHDVTIVGPGADRLAITATGNKNLFDADAQSNYLAFRDITVTGGHNTYTHQGGCVFATHEVRLDNAVVSDCYQQGQSSSGKYRPIYAGGAISAETVRMTNHSAVIDNNLVLTGGFQAVMIGGGIASSYFYCTDSTVSGNYAVLGTAGGVYASGGATLLRCTIDSNGSSKYGGGIQTANAITIDESTISGNFANRGGGIYAKGAVTIRNSTVAFNFAGPNFGSGIDSPNNLSATSTIIAKNTNEDGNNLDVVLAAAKNISGPSNLIMYTTANAASGVIVSTSDPLLVPLGAHGGPTRTHALSAGSPAIDAGKNPQAFAADQRGTGFAREAPTGKPDIGAYEKQAVDDEIFYDGFGDG